MSNRLFSFLLILPSLAVTLFVAMMLYFVVEAPVPTFRYSHAEGNTAVCVGDPLTATAYGYSEGLPNITEIVETVYVADSTQIAQRFPRSMPLTNGTVPAQPFSFPLAVDVSGLPVGRYYYVRTAAQTVAGGWSVSSEFAQLRIDFEVVDCSPTRPWRSEAR